MKRQLLLLAACYLIGSSSAWAEDGKYVVLFPLGKATLDAAAHATIASAKQEYDRTGSTHITLVGHTDTTGSASFNQKLSERRARAVADALEKLGVPAASISESGVGESQLAVQTGPNVKEAQNRRTEIDVIAPPPPAPAPAPVAEAPPPPPAPMPPEEKRLFLNAGLFYGYNFHDKHDSHSQLVGLNFGLEYKVIPWMSLGVQQAVFYNFSTHSDGVGGRTVAGPDFYFGSLFGDNVPVDPYIGGYAGYIYGTGMHDVGIAGPELGLKVGKFDMGWAEGMFDMKVAYDIPFSGGADKGVVNTTIGVSFAF